MRTIQPGEAIGSDRAAVSNRIIAQMRTAVRELRCLSGDRMRRAELSFTNLHILSMLERHGDMPMSRLAEMLDISLSNASGLIDRLEDHGFVERVRVADDRRVVTVHVTEVGQAALARAEVLKDELLGKILGRLDDERLGRLAAALEDVATAAGEVFATDPDLVRHEHAHPTPVSASRA